MLNRLRTKSTYWSESVSEHGSNSGEDSRPGPEPKSGPRSEHGPRPTSSTKNHALLLRFWRTCSGSHADRAPHDADLTERSDTATTLRPPKSSATMKMSSGGLPAKIARSSANARHQRAFRRARPKRKDCAETQPCWSIKSNGKKQKKSENQGWGWGSIIRR